MTQSKRTFRKMGVFFFILLLISPVPVIGQFVLPFLYMPLEPLFSKAMGDEPKHLKVTSQHVRTAKGWSLAVTYNQTMENIKNDAIIILVPSSVTVSSLTDLDYYWSYTIPFSAMNGNLSDPDFVLSKKAEYMQEELLKFISQKFVFDINDVASTLGIPSANLSSSYDPANWAAVVHAMISQSSSVFTRLLELPSVNSLAELVDVQPQDLLNANLSRFEDLVFRFIPKKTILDANTTSYLITSSGIVPARSYNDVTVAKILQQHGNITLSFKEFGILYNLTNEQAKAIGRATFHQIYRMCGVLTETILNITLPEVSWKVVGSMRIIPPCPVLIAIKGKSIASFEPVINPQNTTVLEILTTVYNFTWHDARLAVNASLPDWEFLDSVTLIHLATISGNSLETLLNDSVSEAVELVFRMQADGSLNNATDTHRAFIRRLLEEKFNMTLNEVANFTGMPEVSFLNASSPWLFRSFVAATFTYFRLNLSHIVASVQLSSEEVLYNLPRQEWKSVISAVINSVIKSEAADLQMSDDNLLQLLGVSPVELSISQLKRLIKSQILEAKLKKRKFEDDPISLYLSQNSVSDADYLNSTVLSLVLAASGYSQEELKLAYGYNSAAEIFILSLMRIKDLPLYCSLNTPAIIIKDRTPYNITAELVGTRGIPAVCRSTRFYIAARVKNMSLLQIEFSLFSNSSLSFVTLVELVTDLPWRRNVWAFGLNMEDWTVLYVLNEDSFKEVTAGLNFDSYQSRTLLQIFVKSLELKREDNPSLRAKIQENRNNILEILYEVFNTNENELMKLSTETNVSLAFSLMIDYLLVGKFNISVSSLETSLDLQPGDLYKLSPTEWPEMIPLVKAEMIRSGQHQLGVSLSNFAKLLEETPESLQSLTFAQIKFKWDSVISKVLKGKRAIERESVSHIAASIGIASDFLNDVTVLVFTEDRVNVTKSELLLLYNFSSIAIDVLSNYTFGELLGLCGVSKEILFNKTPLEIIVSLLGHDNDTSCLEIARVAAASSITVSELADKFSLNVNDNVNLLTMFEDLFNLPWPKIAWAVNASLPDWHILGALSLKNVSTLISQSTQNMRMQKSFRGIVTQLLDLSENVYTEDMNEYRSNLVTLAADLFRVNSSKICDDCKIVDILWNALTQLNQLIDFDPYMLPNELNVSPYEFNLTIPSQWPLTVKPVVRGAYSRASIALAMDRDRLSILLQTPTAVVENMTLTQYQVFLSQSIQPFIAAKTALIVSPLADLVVAKGLAALANESVFDVIDELLSVPMRNISFIFNWTSEQQAKLKIYTLDDMTYYKGVGLQSLGNETLLALVEYILQNSLPPRPPPPCKRGFTRVGNDERCIPKDECSSNRCGDDSLCQNYLGGFDCECKSPGHFKVNINGKCKPCKTFSGTLTITNREFQSLLKNKSTEDFFDLKELFESTVNEELKKSTISTHYYGCRVQDFRSGSVVVDFLIFTSPDFTGTIKDLKNALVGRVNNSTLGPFSVPTSEVAVEDFDECKAHQDNCGHHATCENKAGSFECKCNDGYDGDGLTCEGGFFKTMWWTVIVAAFLLLLIVIIIVCLVIRRPKPSGRYGLEMNDSSNKHQPNRGNSEASKISYRTGDVYYKDKEGKMKPGTAHRPNSNGIEQRPHTPHFVEEDEFQPSNSIRAKTPFELAVERNKRISGEFPSPSKSPFEVTVERNARNGNVYEDTVELNMTELPIASVHT